MAERLLRRTEHARGRHAEALNYVEELGDRLGLCETLEGVAGVDSLNQADLMHPTAAGQRRVAGTVWKVLEPVLRGEA